MCDALCLHCHVRTGRDFGSIDACKLGTGAPRSFNGRHCSFFLNGLGRSALELPGAAIRLPGNRLLAAILYQRTVNGIFCSNSKRFRYKDFPEDCLLVYDFAAVLCALSSARLYEFQLQSLYFGGLPSRAAAKRYLHLQAGPPLCEPGLTPERLDGIVAFYERLGYKERVFYIAHDATACLPRLRYNTANNTLVGIAVSDEDLPRTAFCAPDTYDELLDLLQQHDLGTQVELYCLKPGSNSLPAYIVALFLQISTPTAGNVQRRLQTIVSYLASHHGIAVLGYSADGAPAHLKAMHDLQYVCLIFPSVCLCVF